MSSKYSIWLKIGILILTFTLSFSFYSIYSFDGLVNFRLAVYICPPIILADGNSYKCIYVQIQDFNGNPIIASNDVTVYLSSSNLDVGIVEEEIVIRAGESFGVASFTTTFNPGETIITAIAEGYGSGEAVLRTVNPYSNAIPPFKLKIYASPLIAPADSGFTGIISVELLDSNDYPLIAMNDIPVILTSSNTSVISVPSLIIIRKGSSYAETYFKVIGKVGSSIITASTQGYYPSNITISVVEPGIIASNLKLSVCPSILLPDNLEHEVIVVQLVDVNGFPVKADRDYEIYLSSSNLDIGLVEEKIVIEEGSYYTIASFKSKFSVGSTIIVASAQNLEPTISYVHVRGYVPSRLAVYSALPQVFADGKSKNIIVIQVQDDGGFPVYSVRDVNVYLISSINLFGSPPLTVTIGRGENYIIVPFKTTSNAGFTSIIACASGFKSGSTSLNTTLLPLNLTLIAPSQAKINEVISVTVLVTSYGVPIANAELSWTITGGEIISGINVTDVNGEAHLKVKLTKETLRITINAFKTGYSIASETKVVRAILPPKPPAPLIIEFFGFKITVFTIIIIISVLLIILIILYLYLKSRYLKS